MPKYVGRRIVPKHGGIWDKTKEYEELIIVLCQETGVSYISKLPVPAGTEIFNEHYWAVCSEFSEQIRLAEDHLTRTAEDVHTELTETESRISKNVSETEERVTQKLTDTGNMEGSFTSENEMVAIEELDRRAFASAFRYSIEKLQQLYPAAKIYICTPIQGYITTRSYAQSKAKGDYLKLLAGRMSLEVIDTFCCGICDIYEKKNANGRYLIDGLHPNAAGAKKIGVFNASAVIASYR